MDKKYVKIVVVHYPNRTFTTAIVCIEVRDHVKASMLDGNDNEILFT